MRKNFPTVRRWRSKSFVFALRLAFRFVSPLSYRFAVSSRPFKKHYYTSQLVVIVYSTYQQRSSRGEGIDLFGKECSIGRKSITGINDRWERNPPHHLALSTPPKELFLAQILISTLYSTLYSTYIFDFFLLVLMTVGLVI